MDTSKEYIEMCKQAEEIQKLKKSIVGDFVFDKVSKNAQVEIIDKSNVDCL